nr:hypothetical protein Q903MT_gene2514 [Picea sitchensis]
MEMSGAYFFRGKWEPHAERTTLIWCYEDRTVLEQLSRHGVMWGRSQSTAKVTRRFKSSSRGRSLLGERKERRRNNYEFIYFPI